MIFVCRCHTMATLVARHYCHLDDRVSVDDAGKVSRKNQKKARIRKVGMGKTRMRKARMGNKTKKSRAKDKTVVVQIP